MSDEQVIPMSAVSQIIALDMKAGPRQKLQSALDDIGEKRTHGLAGGGDTYLPVAGVQQLIDDGTLPIRETKPNTPPQTVRADVDRVLSDYGLQRPNPAAKAAAD